MIKLNKKSPIGLLVIVFHLVNLIVFIILLLPTLAINITIWWLDNLLNLQIQLSVIALLLMLINLIYIRQLTRIYSLLYVVVITTNLIPLYLTTPLQITINKDNQRFTIAQLNVSYNNPNLQLLLPILGDSHFDLLVLQEVSDKQHHNIKQLTRYYPYSFGLSSREATPSGLAIFSRWLITEKHLHDFDYKSGQLLEIIIQAPGSIVPIQVYALHPSSPRNEKLWKRRNKTLVTTAEQVTRSPFINKIIIGDFNSSPWSSAFKNFQKSTQLKNTANGFGYIPSWSYSTKPLLSILSSVYIDHNLVSRSFDVVNKHSRYIQGSDHQLLITELVVNN